MDDEEESSGLNNHVEKLIQQEEVFPKQPLHNPTNLNNLA